MASPWVGTCRWLSICASTRVAALVLCDTGPGYRRDEPRAQWNATVERRAANFEQRGFDALGGSPEVAASQQRSPGGLARAARGIMAQHRLTASSTRCRRSRCPRWSWSGPRTSSFLGAADMMAAKIPGATKVVLAGAGHGANIDQPEAFDRAVLDFLDRL